MSAITITCSNYHIASKEFNRKGPHLRMVNSVMAALVGYGASCVSTFVLYPYRDYTKIFRVNPFTSLDPIQYALARYKGMILNPSQPLLLALPWGLLYGGFALGSGGLLGALAAGTFHGMGKVAVRTIARRVGGPRSRYDAVTYRSLIHCLQESTRQYGILSFFSGVSATMLISAVWHGASLVALQRSRHDGFFWGMVGRVSCACFFNICHQSHTQYLSIGFAQYRTRWWRA
ncbi:uncharacterized protein Tco025E_08087 [Trypanosoma conorhini]|uniref:Mitochondrial carrier protein n=1 Tax=Trypanosoma conorhini TaxID=83891 RepID=A0A422NG40_9TRYP|nr:uncharacterized protein Tco025E_08087 [Trypanosoma conorhini]RNF04433.1 hypothetical protein Tco025E_08087 [Trypanosoma conorhini]